MSTEQFKLNTIVSMPFGENTFIARLQGRADCLVVDPGLEPETIIDSLDSLGLEPAAILNTHGHGDHIGGNAALKSRWPDVPLVIGAADAEKLTDATLNLSATMGVPIISPPADVTVHDGETYSAAGFRLNVRAVPGHTRGHVVFVWEDGQPTIVFVGDVIFAGSIGRTDFPDGDFRQIEAGIRSQIYTLPDDTILLSGHGPETTVGHEKQSNPFVRPK
ncbi:MAG: MBL fold metallo-hydrolase [Candidatus Nealsonbacteria bacterium]|nr:MBL fold metallo-hydrolase [Candidatus Nealsonbacteria bacterium]